MDEAHPLLRRLETQLSALPTLLGGIPEKDLQARIGGRWSVAENVAHLARHTDLTLERVERILAEDAPSLRPTARSGTRSGPPGSRGPWRTTSPGCTGAGRRWSPVPDR